jgi:hypothetical protein
MTVDINAWILAAKIRRDNFNIFKGRMLNLNPGIQHGHLDSLTFIVGQLP